MSGIICINRIQSFPYPLNVMETVMDNSFQSDGQEYTPPIPRDRALREILAPYYDEMYQRDQFPIWEKFKKPRDFMTTFIYVLHCTSLTKSEAAAIEAIFRDHYIDHDIDEMDVEEDPFAHDAVSALKKLRHPSLFFPLYYGGRGTFQNMKAVVKCLQSASNNDEDGMYIGYVPREDCYISIWEMGLSDATRAVLAEKKLSTASDVAAMALDAIVTDSGLSNGDIASLCAAMRSAGFVLVRGRFIYYPYGAAESAIPTAEYPIRARRGVYSLERILDGLKNGMTYISVTHTDQAAETNRRTTLQAMDAACDVMEGLLAINMRDSPYKTHGRLQPAKTVITSLKNNHDRQSIMQAIRYEARKKKKAESKETTVNGRNHSSKAEYSYSSRR